MNFKFLSAALFLSLVLASSYKAFRNTYTFYEKNLFTEQICHATEARLQVGATREVLDFARASLTASGYSNAEVTLKTSGFNFSETRLNANEAAVFSCKLSGIEGVDLSVYFPKSKFFATDFSVVLFLSFIVIWLLKVAFVIVVRGLQTDFTNEVNRMISKSLGIIAVDVGSTPFWMKWLHQLNPTALKEFKTKIINLENKIEQQAEDLKNEAAEKAVKESQLIQAKKFKDLVHQIRHDLRQTVAVIRSSLELIPTQVNGRNVLKGAIGSLDTMISDLRERELKHDSNQSNVVDLIEVIIAEVIREQQVALASEEIKINFLMNSTDLHFTAVPREELKRVFTNLIVNSSESIHADGVIDVLTEVCENEIVVSIIDNGSGFSDEALANLFKKGFTTKQNGSGRGLSFAQEKIREWSGKILVDSRIGKTVIEITLPVTKAANWAHPELLANENQVVLVDDHPIDLSNVINSETDFKVYNSLYDFEADYEKGFINSESAIVFDLHLENGRRGTEALALLDKRQNYVFMTSDYLNEDLCKEAQARQFKIIPKELVGFGLIDNRNLNKTIFRGRETAT